MDANPERIACLGPEATFSHNAALDHFGANAEFRLEGSIPRVFQAVETERAGAGLVPVENSIEGSVGITLDGFLKTACRIHAEHYLRIEHHLLGPGKRMADIRRVYSHPQALSQCRDWLARHLPQAAVLPTASTAEAALLAAEAPDRAVVGSVMLAERYGLNLLAQQVQDRTVNLTRFWIIRHRPSPPPPPTGCDRTSLMVFLAHRPGALHDCLGHIAARGINLTRIESRPCPDTPFQYRFFLDMDGHAQDATLSEALTSLRAARHAVTLLGSYPRVLAPPS